MRFALPICFAAVLIPAAPAYGQLNSTAQKGSVQLRAADDVLVDNIQIRVNALTRGRLLEVAPRSISGQLERAGQQTGADPEGSYTATHYRLQAGPGSSGVAVTLTVRQYVQPEVIVALLDYSGPPVAATGGIQLTFDLPKFMRGLAIHRTKLWWTAPVFASEPALLPPNNQLLLWQRAGLPSNYYLLAPLAGGGMISEIGTENYQLRVSLSSYDPHFVPQHLPVFAFAASNDPYRLAHDTYAAAFAATNAYGRPRWQKAYPEIFRWLGWCSWNTYYQDVTEEKVLASMRSLKAKDIPVRFVLVDDGWLSVDSDRRLTGYEPDHAKFPHGFAGMVETLREAFGVQHVGVWHAFQGYWNGVDRQSEIARSHAMLVGDDGKTLPDPRDDAGASFYADWYRDLKDVGIDFVKVDNQGSNGSFTNGRLSLFESGGGEERNVESAAAKYFSATSAAPAQPAVNLLNCMAMSFENAFNWRLTNLARSSDDYYPNDPQDARIHVFQNAYNAYWMANFAWPDWDMFETGHPDGEFHAIARAISGGPIYTTDSVGKERPELLKPIALSTGRLLMLDEPGEVTRDVLFTDTSLTPAALKVFGTITRPGLKAGMVAAFNVNNTSEAVTGVLRADDVQGLSRPGAPLAVFQRKAGQVSVLNGNNAALPFSLPAGSSVELFTLAPIDGGAAIFGLLDKYLGPAAVVSVTKSAGAVTVRVAESGDFGAWLERAPDRVEIDGKPIAEGAFEYTHNLLHIPVASFGTQIGEHEIKITLGR